jgi:hypothetical protein
LKKDYSVIEKGEEDLKNAIIELTMKLDHKTLVIWATDCAEHVLSFFEEKYPNNDRPRKAIEAGRAWVQGKMSVGEVRTVALAAHAAAREAEEGEARAVARAAGHAAATVHVAAHAIHAANYAAKVTATERIWQYQHLLDLAKNEKITKF